MSTPVVVEAAPRTPPPVEMAPATPTIAITSGVASPVQQQLNGSCPSSVPPLVATAPRESTASTDRVTLEMATDKQVADVVAKVVGDAVATTEATILAEANAATIETAPVAEAMDIEPSTNDNTQAASNQQQHPPVPIEYTVRAPQDDARAIALAKRRLEIQIAFMEHARTKIQDESHPDFQQRMVAVDAERERLLALAQGQERYWAHCTSVIYAYECEEATSEFVMNCDKLRQEMLEEIHHEIEIINDQRKGSSSSRKTTRKTRSTRTKAGASGGNGNGGGGSTSGNGHGGAGGAGSYSDERLFTLDAAAPQKAKKRVGNAFTQLENKLAQSEVDHDLRELAVSMDSVAKKRRMDPTQSPFVAKYHRANFLYRDFVFQEGDEIFVRNLMTGSDYVAIICSITSTELFVLSEKGKYARLVFMDLRQGRVVVSQLTADQAAALNDREDRAALRG